MKFDTVFDLQGFGETSLLARLTGASVRVGRVKGSQIRKRCYTVPIQRDWEHEHRANYFLRAVQEACGVHSNEEINRPALPRTNKPPNFSPSRIGLNLGASTASRRWSEHNFLKLAGNLSRRGIIPRFFLGPQEPFLESTVKAACQQNGWEIFALKHITYLIEALSECDLLVSNDTGPGHLAAALDLPVVTLFSTGSPENVRPLATRAKWFRDETDINRISVEGVEKACLELLGLS
jgi:heptosyltransferase-1